MVVSLRRSKTILIPEALRGQPVTAYPMSQRLVAIFREQAVSHIGQLHEQRFAGLRRLWQCDAIAINDLREWVRLVQAKAQPGSLLAQGLGSVQPYDQVQIPGHSQAVALSELPLSTRLAGGLAKMKLTRLGDLHGLTWQDFHGQFNLGTTSRAELARLVERAHAGEFNLDDLRLDLLRAQDIVPLLDRLVSGMKDRARNMLKLRLGADGDSGAILDQIGDQCRRSRQAIQQFEVKYMEKLQKQGGSKLQRLIQKVAADCAASACPLTPAWVEEWSLGRTTPDAFSPKFYARLLRAFAPDLPVWLEGNQVNPIRASAWDEPIQDLLVEGLRQRRPALPFKEVFTALQRDARISPPTVEVFLKAMRQSRCFKVESGGPRQFLLALRHLTEADRVRIVLQASDRPLRLEEIKARVEAQLGCVISASFLDRDLGNEERERMFYRLGPLTFGLRQHFLLPARLWAQVQTDCVAYLRQAKHPVLAPTILRESHFSWVKQTNAYELVALLGEDPRFTHLGRFRFGLTEWGVSDTAPIRKLIPKLLAEQGWPMTAREIYQRLLRIRPISFLSTKNFLWSSPDIQDCGYGLFGLKLWGRQALWRAGGCPAVMDSIILKAPPRLCFGDLCAIVGIASEGADATRLWEICGQLQTVQRIPDQPGPDARLIHARCPLILALADTARALHRSCSASELQREMNLRFGGLFAAKTTAHIQHRLRLSQHFERDADGRFMLVTRPAPATEAGVPAWTVPDGQPPEGAMQTLVTDYTPMTAPQRASPRPLFEATRKLPAQQLMRQLQPPTLAVR